MAKGTSGRNWAAEYEAVRPMHERFCEKLDPVLRELLSAYGIDFSHTQKRAKKVHNFAKKLSRKSYANPLAEMTDLSGLRIITYSLDDVARVWSMLEKEFLVDHGHSVRKAAELPPDRFGYLSDHVVIRLGPDRAAKAEWEAFQGVAAEIQIRTVLQHAWASIDHKLEYKSEIDLPREVTRTLSRLSALLELADEQFDVARRTTDELAARYAEQVANGELGAVELDVVSLAAYFAETNVQEEWASRAATAGFGSCEWWTDEYADIVARDRSDLLYALRSIGLRTLAEFEALQESAGVWGAGALRRIASSWNRTTDDELAPTPENILTMIALCSSDVRSAAAEIYDPRVATAIISFVRPAR